MESGWNVVLTSLNAGTWLEVVQPATFKYFRWLVDVNKIFQWLPGSQTWSDVTSTIATIVAAGTLSPVNTNTRQV